MSNQTLNKSEAAGRTGLDAYLIYVSDEGLDFDCFVEHGGRLVAREDSAKLALSLLHLPRKIEAVRENMPRLALQLEFLAVFCDSPSADLPELIWNECAFALIYATKESDLIPDGTPEIGYCDDAAVVDAVLRRHADFFARDRAGLGFDWAAVRPEKASSPND